MAQSCWVSFAKRDDPNGPGVDLATSRAEAGACHTLQRLLRRGEWDGRLDQCVQWCRSEHFSRLRVERAIAADLHDVRVVLGEPRIDARRVCLCSAVADRGVMRGRDGVRGVGNDANLVLTHRGGMRDEDVSRLGGGQRLRLLLI